MNFRFPACAPATGRAVLLSVLSFSAAVPARALEWRAGAEATVLQVRIAGERFEPAGVRLRLAAAPSPEWEIGVLAGAGVADDTEATVTAALESQWAGYVRYSASLDGDSRLALTVGYGETSLDVTSRVPGMPGASSYSGIVYGLSLQERLSRHPRWTGELDVERWYDDAGLRIDSVSYGFRRAF